MKAVITQFQNSETLVEESPRHKVVCHYSHTCSYSLTTYEEGYRFITFHTTCTGTGSTVHMLNINYNRTSAARHYFNHIVLLGNSAINLNESFKVVRYKLINFLWSYFTNHFNPLDTCTYPFGLLL